MKYKVLVGLGILILFSTIVFAGNAPPPIPTEYWGELIINDELAVDGTEINYFDGNDWIITTTTDGLYNIILTGGDSDLTFIDDPDCTDHDTANKACIPCLTNVEPGDENHCIEGPWSDQYVELNIKINHEDKEYTKEHLIKWGYNQELVLDDIHICIDSDKDGYGNIDTDLTACTSSTTLFDCNDNDIDIYPGADEICDGIDNDCDSTTEDGSDEGIPYNDKQEGICLGSRQVCNDGWIDDYSGIVGYEVNELTCDGMDNDCDGSKDEDFIDEDCSFICELDDFIWTNNGDNLNCCGNDVFEADPYQETETNCEDTSDNDCDGLVDDLDPDCFECSPGEERLCPKQEGVCVLSEEICSTQGKWSGCDYSEIIGYESEEVSCDDTSDNDCDNLVDNLDSDCFECVPGNEDICGSGECAGTKTCITGFWGDCSTKDSDGGICALCDSGGNPTYDETQDSDCSCNADECIDGNNDHIFDTFVDYPIAECDSLLTCKNCEPEAPSANDARCREVPSKVMINSGWNLISLPLVPENPISFNDIQDESCITIGPLWYWDTRSNRPAYKSLNFDNSMSIGEGYWVYSFNECDFMLQGYRFDIGLLGNSGELATGWNMIGAPSRIIEDIEDNDGRCDGLILEGLWGWGDNQYEGTHTLWPGKGYWIKVSSQCNLG
jgi:hypothetical protein